MITDRDMKDAIKVTLDGLGAHYDIQGIFEEIHAKHGLTNLYALNDEYYWGVVMRHDITRTAAARTVAEIYKTATATPAPGPVWTNGMAPAASTVPSHPDWCDRHHGGANATTRHRLELLSMVVLDDQQIDEVPLTVTLERIDSDSGPGTTVTLLSIGHAMYQPTAVTLTDHNRARLMAALLTARQLKDMP